MRGGRNNYNNGKMMNIKGLIGKIWFFVELLDRGGNREERYNNYGNRGGAAHHQNRGGSGAGTGGGGGGGRDRADGGGSGSGGSQTGSYEERRTSESMSQLSLEGKSFKAWQIDKDKCEEKDFMFMLTNCKAFKGLSVKHSFNRNSIPDS